MQLPIEHSPEMIALVEAHKAGEISFEELRARWPAAWQRAYDAAKAQDLEADKADAVAAAVLFLQVQS